MTIVKRQKGAAARLAILQIHCVVRVIVGGEMIRVRGRRERDSKILSTFQISNYLLQS